MTYNSILNVWGQHVGLNLGLLLLKINLRTERMTRRKLESIFCTWLLWTLIHSLYLLFI